MRVVLDINILVSALIQSQGNPAALVRGWRAGKFVLITSQAQIDHTADVLQRPHLKKYEMEVTGPELLAELEFAAEIVEPRREITASSDPEDNLILGAAIAGQADYLVTGDKPHLLDLQEVEGVKIIRAAEAVRLFADE